MLRARARISVLFAALLAGCGGPVRWEEPSAIDVPPPGAPLVIRDGRPAWGAVPPAPASLPPVSACPGSMRTARLSGKEWFAVWWTPRADSSARLDAARSTDGGVTWAERAPVDTTDRGTSGCRRPPPALATDSASQYVHTAYWLVAPEGAGVFFSHSMPGHFMFHSPVPVMYGERSSRADVAASGNLVVVAYEDPNSLDNEVWVAISRTQGHLYDERVNASAGGGAAAPHVTLAGARVAVAWERRERNPDTGERAGAGTGMMARIGEVKQ